MALDQGETVRKETAQQGRARACIAAQRWEEPGAPRSWEQSKHQEAEEGGGRRPEKLSRKGSSVQSLRTGQGVGVLLKAWEVPRKLWFLTY